MSVAGSPTESRQTFTRSDDYVGDRVVIPLKPFFVASNLVPHRRAIEELKRSEPLAFLWTNDGLPFSNPIREGLSTIRSELSARSIMVGQRIFQRGP